MFGVMLSHMSLGRPAPAHADPMAPVLVFVVPEEGSLASRLAMDRLRSSIEISGDYADPTSLGVSPGGERRDPARALRWLTEADDAWYGAAFDEAEAGLRDAAAWALREPSEIAGRPELRARFYRAAVLLARLNGLAGRDAEDATVLALLAWWGGGPLSEEEYPPDWMEDLRALEAKARAGCHGSLHWAAVGLGDSATGGEACALIAGGTRSALTARGSVELPCGTHDVLVACGREAPRWRREVVVAASNPGEEEGETAAPGGSATPLQLSLGLERRLVSLGPRSLELFDGPELLGDLEVLVGARPARIVRVLETSPRLRLGASLWRQGQLRPEPSAGQELGALARSAEARADDTGARLDGVASARAWRGGPWVLYSASLVALGGAVALNLRTNDLIDAQNRGHGSRFDEIDVYRVGSIGTYVGSALLATAGVIWHVLRN